MKLFNLEFYGKLCDLINEYNQENGSNTPDHLLAQYLYKCLLVWNSVTNSRDNWWGVHLEPGNKYFE